MNDELKKRIDYLPIGDIHNPDGEDFDLSQNGYDNSYQKELFLEIAEKMLNKGFSEDEVFEILVSIYHTMRSE